jgi:peroxiredoxin
VFSQLREKVGEPCKSFPADSLVFLDGRNMRLFISLYVATIILLFSVSSGLHAGQVNMVAPSFRLNDLSGQPVSLENMRGKVVLLDFWATWCLSCREELTELDGLYHKYRNSGFVVIGISVDTSAERVAAFINKRPVGFPVVTDTKGETAEAYRFSGLPAAFLIDRDGVIVRRYRGSGKEMISRYETDITDLLKGQ